MFTPIAIRAIQKLIIIVLRSVLTGGTISILQTSAIPPSVSCFLAISANLIVYETFLKVMIVFATTPAKLVVIVGYVVIIIVVSTTVSLIIIIIIVCVTIFSSIITITVFPCILIIPITL